MIVSGRLLVEAYFDDRPGFAGIRSARRQFDAWLAETTAAAWRHPAAVKAKYASASVVGDNRVVFNIAGNRFRLVTAINYRYGVVDIRFFGSHAEHDRIDVETV
ncbi:MAG: type II toxin-antitoxin system HigB family toxin [Alphaproteobacteria bacterium]|nr:type II toxin-antitoxin system HigB family toxin [Alphaproteobacteria bacterium]